MMLRIWTVMASLSLMHGTGEDQRASAPTALRGAGEEEATNEDTTGEHHFVYFNGLLDNDLGVPELSQVLPHYSTLLEFDFDRYHTSVRLYQLPEEGSLPELLTQPLAGGRSRQAFGAIVRYNPNSDADVQRVVDWILANRAQFRQVVAINYPVEDRAALASAEERLRPCGVVICSIEEVTGDFAPVLIEILPTLLQMIPPHATVPIG